MEYIEKFFPSTELIRQLAIPLFLIALAAAMLSGWLKIKVGWRTPYTRKTFHFIIFSTAGYLQFQYGLKAVSLFGVLVAAMVVLAVLLGNRWWFYSALARETDAPHEKKFILFPLMATALGGVISNILFPTTAFIGYFVGGWGDAVGEPIGTKWGKNKYTVPTLFGVKATRSLQGSVAVFVVSALVAALCLFYFWTYISYSSLLYYSLLCGVVAAGIEAISSHGLDNLTIQLFASGTLYLLLS